MCEKFMQVNQHNLQQFSLWSRLLIKVFPF